MAVVGSGAGGLSAGARRPRAAGRRSRSTSAASGRRHDRAVRRQRAGSRPTATSTDDTPEPALAYLRALALGDANDELLQVFVREAARPPRWLERDTPLRWQPIPYSDYHAELEGGREQGGRTLEPQPIDPTPARSRDLIRDAPNVSGADHLRRAAPAARSTGRRSRARDGAGIVDARPRRCSPACSRRASTRASSVRTGVRVRELPGGRRRRPRDRRLRARPGARAAFLRGPLLAPVGAPDRRGRRAADGDGRRRRARAT